MTVRCVASLTKAMQFQLLAKKNLTFEKAFELAQAKYDSLACLVECRGGLFACDEAASNPSQCESVVLKYYCLNSNEISCGELHYLS